MKCYVHEKGAIFVGKAWQVRQMIRQYQKQYKTLHEWVEAVKPAKK
ncbi:hypothetical protein GCM10008967_41510 [Bacillus carboniphilus]|uniref:Z-ring formation inhibitor MciZ n=1 Tax=Bacillus carboniphilus TaxID=86663 RepID=A0ABN0WU62_9BACI